MRQTLPKSIILRGYQSFTNVITRGVSVQGAMLTAFLLTDTDDLSIAIGFSVPKKQVPLAANRNRIKRLMREVARKNFEEVCIAGEQKKIGAKIVLMFKKEKTKDVRRITLADIEGGWIDIHRRILKAL